MKKILLTQGKFTLVDDKDYEWLNQWKWHAQIRLKSGLWYAHRGIWNPKKKRMKNISMHRVIMDAPEDLKVDHWNHNGLDNQRINLRLCSSGQNQQNQRQGRGGASIYKGVHKHPINNKKGFLWRARIGVNNKGISLGLFHNERDAAFAYNVAAQKYFGEFACLNNLDEER